MNYRHAYHAGNFADVLKHAVLVRVIEYMKRKDTPFRVIDTHAGAGRYALTSRQATSTGEWQAGIARLLGPMARPLPPAAAGYLAPYLEAVKAENCPLRLAVYPGSPSIALRLLRPQDRLIANELHPEALAQLRAAIGRDPRAKLLALDAFVALKSLLPPKERRGVVLIDPPFEAPGELLRVADGLAAALKRFATGIYIAWYPGKDAKAINRFHSNLASLAAERVLRVEMHIQRPERADRLTGCGLIIVNPPYGLESELATLLPVLSRLLSQQPTGAGYRLDFLGNGVKTAANSRAPAKQRVRPSR